MMSQGWNIAQRARNISTLPLTLGEKASVLSLGGAVRLSHCEGLLSLTLCGPTTQRTTVRGTGRWGLTRDILAETAAMGGIAPAPLGSYALWIHSQGFVQHVRGTTPGGVRSVDQFEEWARSVGMVLTLDMLPYIGLAPRTRQPPGHLGTSCIAYPRLLRRFAAPPPPPSGRGAQLGVWHSSLFTDSRGRSAAPPKLVRCGFASWREVFSEGYLRLDLSRQLKPHWRVVLASAGFAVHSVQSGLAEWRQRAPCDMGSWPIKWKSQNVLVAIPRGAAPPVAGMGSWTWGLFCKLRIPGWDNDFVRRALWRKLAVASRLVAMTRCSKCAFDGKDETHAHVFGECRFGQFVHEAVRHTFGPLKDPEGTSIDLSCNFLQKQEVALTTTQGILSWSGMSVAWAQRCQAVLGKQTVSLHTMVAPWMSKLEFWRQSTNLSVHRSSISPLLFNLRSWIDTGSLDAYWHVPKGTRYLLSLTDAQRTSLKSKNVLKEVDKLQRGGWTVVFADGSSKRVGGWD